MVASLIHFCYIIGYPQISLYISLLYLCSHFVPKIIWISVFIGHKEGMKGYKLWDPTSRRKMYSRDAVFREVIGKAEPKEIVHIKNNPERMQFEIRKEEYDLYELNESKEEVEQQTSVIRRSKRVRKLVERYSPPDFHSAFVLNSINGELKLIDEVV
jgi:hypothetical protein